MIWPAAILVLMEEAGPRNRSLQPMALIVACGLGGVAPDRMGPGPIPLRIRRGRARGLNVADVDLSESNAAFVPP